MRLDERALASVLPLRRPRTFAIGSRILMENGSATETNWTDIRYPEHDAAEIIERNPDRLDGPRGCLYVGGGAGLFRVSLLKSRVKETGQYAPFYWEDVEWGARAWLEGYHSVFCPASRAVHAHRQTVRRYYGESEISRIFDRNRLLFHMRNLPGVRRLEERLLALDETSWREVLAPVPLVRILAARARAFLAPETHDVLCERGSVAF